MIILNTREELVEFLYGANSDSPSTIVGLVKIGGELLKEALSNDIALDGFSGYIENFFPCGDEGEYIEVDNRGTVLNDFLYY